MKEIIDKISSYNLFNYLFPGILFVVLAEKFTGYSFVLKDIILGSFLYYFIGLVISRFGSLIIEPFLRKIKFLQFVPYKEFITASKKDSSIELFSEINNTYRTLTSALVLLIFLKLYQLLEFKLSLLKTLSPFILILLLLIIFVFSYKKQTEYIKKRVEINK